MTYARSGVAAAAFALALAGSPVTAGSEMQTALDAGARKLTSQQIADRFIGRTASFVPAKGGGPVSVYYGADNSLAGSKEGWSGSGFQAVNDRDQICLGWKGPDLPAIRCLDVLLIDDELHKFNAEGTRTGHIVAFTEGNDT